MTDPLYPKRDVFQDKGGKLVSQLLDLSAIKKRTQSNLRDTPALNGMSEQFYNPVDGQFSGNSAGSLKTVVRDYLAKRGLDLFAWENGFDASKRATQEKAGGSLNVFGEFLEPLLKRDGLSKVERRDEIWDSDFWKRNTNGFQAEDFYMPMAKKSNNDANIFPFPFKRSKLLEIGTATDSLRSENPFYIPGGGESQRSLIDFPPFKRFSSNQGFKSLNDAIKRAVSEIHPVTRDQDSFIEGNSFFWPLISTGKGQKRNRENPKTSKLAKDNTRNEPLLNTDSWFPVEASRLGSKRSWSNPPELELNENNNDIWSLWGAKRSTGSEPNIKNFESLLSKLNLHQEAKHNRREARLHPLARVVMSSLGNMDA